MLSISTSIWGLVKRDCVVGDELEDVEAAAEVDAPAGVGDDRTVVDRGIELHVESDAGHRSALLHVRQKSICFWSFSGTVRVLTRHEEDLHLVGRILDDGQRQNRQSGHKGTGEIRLRDLVKESLRMRASRIIVGEVRAEECLDLLLALNAGLPSCARQQRP